MLKGEKTKDGSKLWLHLVASATNIPLLGISFHVAPPDSVNDMTFGQMLHETLSKL